MAADKELMIEGAGVSKVFKDFWGRPKAKAVDGLDIRVHQGAIFGLLGPNGAGKSTLMKMILGHLYPTAGTLRVLGCSPRNVEIKRRIGYVPERSYFYKNLNAEETLRLFGEILNLSSADIRRRTDQLIEMVGLGQARTRLVGEYSHGMGRRLGLAQALLNDPDILILDEPTAGLDPVGCFEVKQLILTLGQRGKTVLMSSHLLADVQDVCDQIMVMYGGKVQQVGPVDELLAQKQEVQFRLPTVSADAIAKAKAVLSAEVGAETIKVSYPTRTLEEYFLDIVRNAHERQVETDGAHVGAGVADYLRTGVDEEALLERLTRRDQEAQPPAEAPVEAPDLGALEELAHPKPATPEATEAGETVDKNLLDRLSKADKEGP